MKGNIYTRQKCGICGGPLRHDERRGGCFCPRHPHVAAYRQFYVKFGRELRKCFRTYAEAERFLNGIRFEEDKGTLDFRDYQADNPLSFEKLAEEFVDERHAETNLSDNYKQKLTRVMKMAIEAWGDRNVKSIGRREIKHFLLGLNVKSKTRANYRSVLNVFFTRWLVEEEILTRDQVPVLPVIEFELGWRNFTDWETQKKIKDKVRELTWDLNPKIYVGIDLLSIYTNLRPLDLLRLEEGHIDLHYGVLDFPRPTKRKNRRKTVRLLDEHVEVLDWLKRKYPALPGTLFFRHHNAIPPVKEGTPFGQKYLYVWWKRACKLVGVEGVDLYGGTRHTSTTQLAKLAGRDAAKDASEHDTNKAFDRYCQLQGERAFEMSKLIRRAQGNGEKIVHLKRRGGG
ncbi:tyrosine-type recombinase/integrase [Pseudodesulfovibrio tunisiensis]|uniref:tyrosine-type recombinase/integrase n=1 Tax=Pseudodesulfovibrio tunisiensis TaxID=463192 RepID=UPI001FB4E657|nr:hypothetical protein [Pseudodesulfovibrio tunisiensis]